MKIMLSHLKFILIRVFVYYIGKGIIYSDIWSNWIQHIFSFIEQNLTLFCCIKLILVTVSIFRWHFLNMIELIHSFFRVHCGGLYLAIVYFLVWIMLLSNSSISDFVSFEHEQLVFVSLGTNTSIQISNNPKVPQIWVRSVCRLYAFWFVIC